MLVFAICLTAIIPGSVHAYSGKLQIPPEGTNQMITLEDGTTLVGRITEVGDNEIKFQTDLGEMTIATTKIKQIKEISASSVKSGKYWFPNPNRTRLLVGPTARTLKAGKGYFYDLWIFFPGLAYGITDNFMISGGASIIPGADDQMFYVMPKYRFSAGKDVDLAATVIAFRLWEETFYFGMGNLTYGTDDRSVSCALGIAFTEDRMAEKPAAMLGGEYRLSRVSSLVGEGWFIPGETDEGMIGFGGLRLFGEQMAVDLGFGLSYDSHSGEVDYYTDEPVEAEVHWLPYIDFVWNF